MNLGLLLDSIATVCPDRVAITAGGRRISYAALHDGARARADALQDRLGGRPLGYVGTNQPAFPLLLFTAAYAGVPFVPLNFRVKQAEYEHYLATSGLGVVVADPRYQAMLRDAAAAVGSPAQPVGLRDLAGVAATPRSAEVAGPDDAVLLFTSGTSGPAKLVRLSHTNLTSYVLSTVECGSAGPDETALLAAPPYHIAAVANTLTSVFRGRRLVLMDRFDAREWLRLVAAESVTHAMVVPTMLARILDVVEAEPALTPDTLRNLSYGGSRPPDGLVERAMTLLPAEVGLVNAFGLTETSSTVAMLTPEDHRAAWRSEVPAVRARLRSVGRPVPGVRIEVLRDDGTPAATGEPGEICVRGEQVSGGYVGGRLRVDDAGRLHTGDLGHVDDEGYLFVDGRLDDLIIRGGENINPHEIEAVLAGHPRVDEALVFGVPDPEWGESVAALVTGADRVGADELQRWVRSRLASYKVPVRIDRVDELPRNDLGKPLRSAARELLGADPGSRTRIGRPGNGSSLPDRASLTEER